MSNLSRRFLDESFAKGFVEGFAGSFIKFCAEGIRDLAQKKQWSLEQAMDVFNIAPTERETYRNILKGKYIDKTGEMSEIDNLGQDIWDRDFSEGFVEVRAESIRSLSKKKKWTLERTMNVLGIAPAEREVYQNLLEK